MEYIKSLEMEDKKSHVQQATKEMTKADREGLPGILDNFGQQSSLHGIRHVISGQKGKWSRITYSLCVLTALIGMVILLIILFSEAYKRGTITKSEVLSSTIPFPTVKICNLSPVFVKDQDDPLIKFMELTETAPYYRTDFFKRAKMTDEILNLTSTEMIERYSFKFEDFIVDSQFDGIKTTKADWEIGLTVANFIGQSRCFSFNGPTYTSLNGPRVSHRAGGTSSGLFVILNIQQDFYGPLNPRTAGAKIFITHYKESPRLGQEGINIAPGTNARLSLSPVKYSFLPAPYKSYGNESCVENEDELLSKMVRGQVYDRNACLYDCVNRRANIDCQCYSADVGEIEGLRECTLKDYLTGCYVQRAYQLTKDLAEKRFTCDCPRRCSFNDYDMKLSSSMYPSTAAAHLVMNDFNETSIKRVRENYLRLHMYIESELVRHMKHEPEFTSEYFLSRVGGQMGLTLGASLITVIEVIEIFFVILYTIIKQILMMIWTKISNISNLQSTNGN